MAAISDFNGRGKVNVWIGALERHFAQNRIPENERLELAMAHLIAPVRGCISSLADFLEVISEKRWIWTWMRLKVALRGIEVQFDRQFSEAIARAAKRAAKKATIATVAFVAGPALFVGGLACIGFSAVGPVAGSIAATAQLVFYGGAVQAGSTFAFCQSAAMGGSAALAAVGGTSATAALATMNALENAPPSGTWKDDKVD